MIWWMVSTMHSCDLMDGCDNGYLNRHEFETLTGTPHLHDDGIHHKCLTKSQRVLG